MPDLVAQCSSLVDAAKISACATIEAAQIAAGAAQTNAIIGAAGSVAVVIAAGIAGYIAYINARRPFDVDVVEQGKAIDALRAELKTTVRATREYVDKTVTIYKGTFAQTVEVRVIPLPSTIEKKDDSAFDLFGVQVTEAIALVRLRLSDYRRAKAPIEQRERPPEDQTPVKLFKRPSDFDSVETAATDYSAALERLGTLL
jgi:hypothetical protein